MKIGCWPQLNREIHISEGSKIKRNFITKLLMLKMHLVTVDSLYFIFWSSKNSSFHVVYLCAYLIDTFSNNFFFPFMHYNTIKNRLYLYERTSINFYEFFIYFGTKFTFNINPIISWRNKLTWTICNWYVHFNT